MSIDDELAAEFRRTWGRDMTDHDARWMLWRLAVKTQEEALAKMKTIPDHRH